MMAQTTNDREGGRDRGGRRRSPDRRGLGALGLLELGPLAARTGVLASLRAAGWLTSSTAAVSRRMAAAVRTRESPAALVDDALKQALDAARSALGVEEIQETLDRIASERPSGAALRRRGEELLARSARVGAEEDRHPAFGVILEELAPDEARILRALATEGDQAAVDVESGGPLGTGGQIVGRRLSALAGLAGCRHPDRIQRYLDNLLRLGLIRLSDDPLPDEQPYDVLAADPAVTRATERAASGTSRAKVLRRRIALSDFGRSFCEACLPLEEDRRRTRRGRARRRSRPGG